MAAKGTGSPINRIQNTHHGNLTWDCIGLPGFTAVATLALIGVGGLVTSHGVGMSVPDWPNTYGYNMFFFPISQWAGGIFYEHSHRLVASAVGLLTVILCLWLQGVTRGGGAVGSAGL